jgi:glycosyltransferase involved in cell wall biosynthesis
MTRPDPSKPPIVAIVTPVYNGGKYLRATMECVQKQTYPHLVHVVLNNNSKDDSAEIIADFADARVPVLAFRNPETLPLAANWNAAFSHIPENVTYAKLLCADDLISAGAIARFVEVAEADPEIEVVLSQDVFNDQIHTASLPADKSVFDGKAVVREILTGEAGWLAYHHFFVRVHPDYRGAFIDDYWSPDPHVVFRSAIRGKFAYLREPLAYNRIHPDSVTGKELNKGVQFQLVGMHLMKRFAGQVYSDQRDIDRITQAFLILSCRDMLNWRLRGNGARSDELRTALESNGYKITRKHYLLALLGWPRHTIQQRIDARKPMKSMTEAAFVAS